MVLPSGVTAAASALRPRARSPQPRPRSGLSGARAPSLSRPARRSARTQEPSAADAGGRENPPPFMGNSCGAFGSAQQSSEAMGGAASARRKTAPGTPRLCGEAAKVVPVKPKGKGIGEAAFEALARPEWDLEAKARVQARNSGLAQLLAARLDNRGGDTPTSLTTAGNSTPGAVYRESMADVDAVAAPIEEADEDEAAGGDEGHLQKMAAEAAARIQGRAPAQAEERQATLRRRAALQKRSGRRRESTAEDPKKLWRRSWAGTIGRTGHRSIQSVALAVMVEKHWADTRWLGADLLQVESEENVKRSTSEHIIRMPDALEDETVATAFQKLNQVGTFSEDTDLTSPKQGQLSPSYDETVRSFRCSSPGTAEEDVSADASLRHSPPSGRVSTGSSRRSIQGQSVRTPPSSSSRKSLSLRRASFARPPQLDRLGAAGERSRGAGAGGFAPPMLDFDEYSRSDGSYVVESGKYGIRQGENLVMLTEAGLERFGCSWPYRERLVFVSELGRGVTSVVFRAFDLLTLTLVAVKKVMINDRKKRHQLAREINAGFSNMESREHFLAESKRRITATPEDDADEVPVETKLPPAVEEAGTKHVLAMRDAFVIAKGREVGVIMEYMSGGSLQDIVSCGGIHDEAVLASIAFQALLGLRFLHGKKTVHRDIKPANLLMTLDGTIKISDFGLTDKLRDMGADDLEAPSHFAGTTMYMAPEQLTTATNYCDTPADIWALGLSIVSVAVGRCPGADVTSHWERLELFRKGILSRVPEKSKWSQPFSDFISQCLTIDPRVRAKAEQLLSHEFLLLAKRDYHAKCLKESGEAVRIGELSATLPDWKLPEACGQQQLDKILEAVQQHCSRLDAEQNARRGKREAWSPGSLPTESVDLSHTERVNMPRQIGRLAQQLCLPEDAVNERLDSFAIQALVNRICPPSLRVPFEDVSGFADVSASLEASSDAIGLDFESDGRTEEDPGTEAERALAASSLDTDFNVEE